MSESGEYRDAGVVFGNTSFQTRFVTYGSTADYM